MNKLCLLIFSILVLSFSACGQESPVESLKNQPTKSNETAEVPPERKIELHLIDFRIQFITGKHEEHIEKEDKKGCILDYEAFKQTFDNDFSQVYEPKTYQKYDARGKFTVENKVYYFDSQGVLNQPFEGFIHVNKPKLTQLVHEKCYT